MPMLLDVITVIIVAIFAVSAYRKGFLNSIVMFLGTVGAMFAALTYSQPIARVIYENYLYERVSTLVAENLDKFSVPDVQAFTEGMQNLSQELPAFFSMLLQSEMGLNAELWYNQAINSGAATISAGIVDTVVTPIAIGLVRVVVFFIMFGVLMAIVNTAAGLLRTVNRIPLIGPLNEILGGVLGALQGMLYVFAVSAVLWFLLSAAGGTLGPFTNTAIDQTVLFRYFYAAGPWADSAIKLI